VKETIEVGLDRLDRRHPSAPEDPGATAALRLDDETLLGGLVGRDELGTLTGRVVDPLDREASPDEEAGDRELVFGALELLRVLQSADKRSRQLRAMEDVVHVVCEREQRERVPGGVGLADLPGDRRR